MDGADRTDGSLPVRDDAGSDFSVCPAEGYPNRFLFILHHFLKISRPVRQIRFTSFLFDCGHRQKLPEAKLTPFPSEPILPPPSGRRGTPVIVSLTVNPNTSR